MVIDMIKFEDFFKVPDESATKVKFNMNKGDVTKPAWDLLLEDKPEWIEMNAYKTKQPNNNLNRAKYLLAFAQYYPYGPNYYIFGGMYKVEIIDENIENDIGYNLTLMDDYKEYIKRLIIKLERPIGWDIYNKKYESVQKSLNPEIYELAPSTKLGTFPGYNSVKLSHKDLQRIVNNDEPSWKNALSNVKGIYVITDKSTGKLYIGSASGNAEGIWQRWSNYADIKNLTGGNKFFDELKGIDNQYIIDNFSYSILEIFDMRTKQEDILNRENFWKDVLKTREFGMNRN